MFSTFGGGRREAKGGARFSCDLLLVVSRRLYRQKDHFTYFLSFQCHLQLIHLPKIMYSFTDPRLVTASSASSKSPLFSPSTTSSSFATSSMHPFFQAFGQLPPFSPFHHSLSPTNHIPPPPNLFFHPHHLNSLHQSPLSNSTISNSSNFFLFPQLPPQLPAQISISTSPISQLPSPTQLNWKENSTPPATVSSTTATSSKNGSGGNRKVYYSNKRKEYEAREEKKVSDCSSDTGKCENSSDLQSNSFSCPICSESGFKGDALKSHFEVELKKFKSSESSKNKCTKDLPVESHEVTKIASFPVDEDDDVFTSVSRDQTASGLSSSWSSSRCSSSSPTSVSSELQKRWEKFRSIRRNRCRRQHRGLISGPYTWNPTSASTSGSTVATVASSVSGPDHRLRGSPLFSPLSPLALANPFSSTCSSSLVRSSPTTQPAPVSGPRPFAYSSFLGEGLSDCYSLPHQQLPARLQVAEEIGRKKNRLSLASSTSPPSSISASSPVSVCSNNSRTSTPNKVECASSPEK